jgi:hypothetical protein
LEDSSEHTLFEFKKLPSGKFIITKLDIILPYDDNFTELNVCGVLASHMTNAKGKTWKINFGIGDTVRSCRPSPLYTPQIRAVRKFGDHDGDDYIFTAITNSNIKLFKEKNIMRMSTKDVIVSINKEQITSELAREINYLAALYGCDIGFGVGDYVKIVDPILQASPIVERTGYGCFSKNVSKLYFPNVNKWHMVFEKERTNSSLYKVTALKRHVIKPELCAQYKDKIQKVK